MDDTDFPVFVAVGPQRTGTTWLHEALQKHPRLCLPRDVKETLFFDRRYDRGFKWYKTYFEHRDPGQKCGEVGPTYFDTPEAPERIYDVNSEPVIVISLRSPVERTFSLYLHELRTQRVTGSFQNAIEQKPRIVTSGHYARYMPRWLDVFGKENVHFVFTEDIGSQPQAVLDELLDAFGVETIQLPEQSKERVNTSSVPRFPSLARVATQVVSKLHDWQLHRVVEWGKRIGLRNVYSGGTIPTLDTELRKRLLDRYEDDIAFVECVTGRDLAHWRQVEQERRR